MGMLINTISLAIIFYTRIALSRIILYIRSFGAFPAGRLGILSG
jgi:hypothetical protein